MKGYRTPTHSSKSKACPPIFLDEKVAHISKVLDKLQDSLFNEITVTDTIEQTNAKVWIT